MSAKTGILLLNLGTPDEPTPPAVARYLREFLMDPFVIDIPYAFRWFLVNVLIAPRRSRISAEAYQKIWTERGSPLKFHSLDLATKVGNRLGPDHEVRLAMRYQNPSLEAQLIEWKNRHFEEIRVLPLYPQYSWAANRSSEEAVTAIAKRIGLRAKILFLKPFYADPGFIDAFADRISRTLQLDTWDHLLLSYHGLPERQIRKADPTGDYCLKKADCCSRMEEPSTQVCYRAQSYETSRLLAKKLGIPNDRWSVSFQSRLGRTKWIEPYTDVVLPELAKKGVKKLVVTCPAFTADCLETIEEIGMRAKEQWQECGGESLRLVPSLNSEELWVSAVAKLAKTGSFR